MATFGKLNFAVAFNPQTAFPLDARSYFDSYTAAELAAKGAVEVGSSDGTYYFGQTLTVVEEQVATFYIIQPDGSLKQVGSDDGPVKVEINENHFKYTEDNKLELIGATEATEGQVLAMDASGALAWVTPVDAYSKTETDSAISSAVANAAHLKRKIVDSVDEINKDAEDAFQYIYMVPKLSALEGDHYDEYMVIEVADVRFVEKVGDWAVDLSEYAKSADVEATYVKKNGTDRLITEAEGEKIAESEKNVIASVSTDFTVSDTRELSLNNISISKVTDLATELNKKVDKQDGYTLLSPTDQKKLAKLTVGDSGNLEVSGSVNASNVKELDQWIVDNRNTVSGLISEADQTKLNNLFDQVNDTQFEIATIGDDQKKQLNLTAVPFSIITGAPFTSVSASDFVVTDAGALSLAKSYVTSAEIGDLDSLVRATGNEDSTLVEEINFINERLTWQELE